MKIKIEIIDGVSQITDADTGKPIDWVDTVDIVIPKNGTSIVYLGTFSCSATLTVGTNTVPAGAPVPTP